ncbi:MAG: system histidine kinase PrsK [Pseudomonadota bacterium]
MGATTGIWQIIGAAAWGSGAFASLLVAGTLYARPDRFGTARKALILALGVTGLWALIGALAGAASIWADMADSLRDLAWLFAVYRLFAIDGRHSSLRPVRPLLAALSFVELLQLAIMLLQVSNPIGGLLADLAFKTVTLFRILVATGGLMLVHNLYGGTGPDTRLVLRWPALAFALLWGFDLNLYTVSYLRGQDMVGLIAVRSLRRWYWRCCWPLVCDAGARRCGSARRGPWCSSQLR